MDVSWDLTGRLFFRDWSFIRETGTPATLTVDASEAGTWFSAFRTSSARCSDPARGTEVDGMGRLDVGDLVAFTIVACDNAPGGSGTDVFRIMVPEANAYERGGSLSFGDLTETGTTPAAVGRARGLGAIGSGTPTLESDYQEFDFDVTSAPAGRLVYRDYSVVRNGAAGNITVDPAAIASTEFRAFHQVSPACVRITAKGRIDTGDHWVFYVDACDNASSGTGFDTFEILLPDRMGYGNPYVRSGALSAGDIVLGSGSPPSHTALVFTVQPSNTRMGSVIQPAVRVTAVDAQGNPVTTFAGAVTIAIGRNGGLLVPGTLSGTQTVSAVNGVATFSDLSIDRLGNGYTLSVTSASVPSTESATFNITL